MLSSKLIRQFFYILQIIALLSNSTYSINFNSAVTESLPILKTVESFLDGLSKCTIRFIGNLSQNFDYFISKGSPIILDDFHIEKYRKLYDYNDPVQWHRNLFFGRKHEKCFVIFFDWNSANFFSILKGILASGREIPNYL